MACFLSHVGRSHHSQPHTFLRAVRTRGGVRLLAVRTRGGVRLVDFLFPPVVSEEELLSSLGPPVVLWAPELRGRGIRHLDCLRAATTYDGEAIRRAIWFFKYRKVRGLGRILGEILRDRVARVALIPPDAVLCPVPLHIVRRLTRGYNQAALLACIVAAQTQLPVLRLLRRRRWTGSQMRRKREERLEAVRGAFAVMLTPPAHIILIDDLATTCATLDACAEVFKAAGAQCVEGWVVAHG